MLLCHVCLHAYTTALIYVKYLLFYLLCILIMKNVLFYNNYIPEVPEVYMPLYNAVISCSNIAIFVFSIEAITAYMISNSLFNLDKSLFSMASFK